MIGLRHLNGPALTLRLLALLWVIIIATLLALKPSIFNPATLTTIVQFSTILALVSLGQALVIMTGGAGIDLSVGGIVSLSAILAMLLAKFGLPPLLLPIACILIGIILGIFNGILITRLAILPLIATLGTFFIYSGLALALTGGGAQSGVPGWLLGWGRGTVAGVPLTFMTITIPAFAIAGTLLAWTAWGRWIYAMGFNERSARLVGIPVDRVRLILYATSGALGGAAALVSIGWLGSARPNIGQNLELESLTAAMLGGIAITGGRGGVGGVLAAVILLVTLKTGLLQLNVNTVWQVGIVGALLIFVLLADRLSQHWR
ncbi:ABC transporter permease [Ensifer sp. ENS06]|uniref:ABC transporter permease n=1 Tax=Ensifer sp. ENS06 TaxID=2769276 RepID=UPI001783178D|nr:ABC transporter permease [Ensifer sp. ENS06]MBD9627049.1 ABC transporter permease [Ensifer sp. ENS06]